MAAPRQKKRRPRRYDPATITRVRPDGSYDLAYDDGSDESRVAESRLRSVDSGSDDDRREKKRGLKPGTRVEAR